MSEETDTEFAYGCTLVRSIATGVTVIVVALIATLGGCTAHRDFVFTKNGYIQDTVPGWNEPVWVKPPQTFMRP